MDDGRFQIFYLFEKKINSFLFILDDNEEQGKEKNKCVLLWQVRKKKKTNKIFYSFFVGYSERSCIWRN